MVFRIMPDSSNAFIEAMKTYTSKHVTAVLKTAYEKHEHKYVPIAFPTKTSKLKAVVIKESILNAYPLENIK